MFKCSLAVAGLTWAMIAVGAGCATDDLGTTPSTADAAVQYNDGAEALGCTDPTADEDRDGISNGEEGCQSGRNSDGDEYPDWQDFDSDNDGVPDSVEAGEQADGKCKGASAPDDGWPCDTDGDGYPDYVDVDSDSDGLLDGDEDPNGDGLVGCCVGACDGAGFTQRGDCVLTEDGCGPGQTCEQGVCSPALSFDCSNGETSRVARDTFQDGKLDPERGTFICRDATEDRPLGRKAVQLHRSAGGDWHVALESGADYSELNITDAGDKEAAGVIDVTDPAAEVAGFVLSRPTRGETVQEELAELIKQISAKPPGSAGKVSVRASGTQSKTHDGYDTIQGTVLDVSLSIASNVSTVRNKLLGMLLEKPMAKLGNLPGPYGSSHPSFVIRFTTVKRVAFARNANGEVERDEDGHPMGDGDKAAWRLVVMGAVAGKASYQDPSRRTGFAVEDLSNGSALATPADIVTDECDVDIIEALPVADIIWVIDESGSMDDKRKDLVNNAQNFFSRAVASGLDFRMGVTGVCSPKSDKCKKLVGKFCSKVSNTKSDDGGVDRFLLPTEQAIFTSCVTNPPGNEGASEYGLVNLREAVTKHLPRADKDPSKIRKDAKLVIIVATDEVPQSLANEFGSNNIDDCSLAPDMQAKVDQALEPYLDLLTGIDDPEAAATVHLLGGLCSSTGCKWKPDVGHGYIELVQKLGGQMADVCQKDLGATLQIIIDSIIADASPVTLETVPISSSLAVALDGKEIERSRTSGFDYRSSKNVLVFIDVPYEKGAEVIASYKRWKKQTVID